MAVLGVRGSFNEEESDFVTFPVASSHSLEALGKGASDDFQGCVISRNFFFGYCLTNVISVRRKEVIFRGELQDYTW